MLRNLAVIIGLLLLIGGTFLVYIFSDRDLPEKFLEDDPALRSHPNYPAKVFGVEHLVDQIVIEKNVWVTMRDGVRLSANVFRPEAPGKYPVVMALTAYDKNKGPDLYPKLLRNSLESDFDLGTFSISPWASWEGPDPAFWVPHGYVVVYVDSRGYASSEGKPATLSMQDRDDFYDAIEWAGTREWSNGNVGLNGVSYLAISQWVAASGNPPHLKAIIPWEGQSDAYREVLYHGGIPETEFTGFWSRKVRSGANGNPLPPPAIFKFAHKRPGLMKWVQQQPANKSGIDLPNIQVPALICATWSDQGLHTRGSFEGYKQIMSEQKWLYTHGRQKWGVYYGDEALAFQKEFFDHFLKEMDNGFGVRQSVRLEVRESLNEYTVRLEDGWPIPNTDYQALYLDAAAASLSFDQANEASIATYDSQAAGVNFSYTFLADSEITGNMKLKLWVSTSAGDDMDLFVAIKKFDRNGDEVPFFAKMGYMMGPVAMGWLRVSQRELDQEKSTPWQPVLTHENPQPISAGEIVSVEVEILPSSTLFRSGETLRLMIKGHDHFEHPSLGHGYSVNEGLQKIHTGGSYDSHLLVPVIPD